MLKGSETDDFVYLLSPEEGVQKLSDSFYHEKSLNYWGLMDEVNPWILKELLQHFIARIIVDRGTVSSVTFKNDFSLHFIISNPVRNFAFRLILNSENSSSIQHDATAVFYVLLLKFERIHRRWHEKALFLGPISQTDFERNSSIYPIAISLLSSSGLVITDNKRVI